MKKIMVHDFEVALDWMRKCYKGDTDAVLTFSDYLEDKGYIEQAQILRNLKPIDASFNLYNKYSYNNYSVRQFLLLSNLVPTMIEPFYCNYFCMMKISTNNMLTRYSPQILKVKRKVLENYCCFGYEYKLMRTRHYTSYSHLDRTIYNLYQFQNGVFYINRKEFLLDEDQDLFEQISFAILAREIGFEKALVKTKEFVKKIRSNEFLIEGKEVRDLYK